MAQVTAGSTRKAGGPFVRMLVEMRQVAGRPTYQTIIHRSRAELSVSAVSKVLNGVVRPSWSTAAAIIAGLGRDPAGYRKMWEECYPTGVVNRRAEPVDDETLHVLREILAELRGLRADLNQQPEG